jgi:lipid-A-disaccharide synthase
MLIAGEPSGDLLAAELVQALRQEFAGRNAVFTTDYQPLHTGLEPRFFGAGGARMAAAGVDLAFDMTKHSVIGLTDVIKQLLKFRRLFQQLLRLARDRQPDVLVCVDFSEFNLRFAHAVRGLVRERQDWFHDWKPRIVRYVSPQVWASREGRARQVAEDCDLLLSIIPFEKAWYAKRVPRLPVEYVGNPVLDRYGPPRSYTSLNSSDPRIVLLPGSRSGELTRHIPVMLGALALIRMAIPDARAVMVLPDESLFALAKQFELPKDLQLSAGNLPQALAEATIAIASSGTVTIECAYFGIPTVAMYKTSWPNYQLAIRVATVRFLALPNILADEEVFPEFIQYVATPENIASAALDLLKDEKRRAAIKARLSEIIAGLGPPGVARRAAQAIAKMLG